MDDSISRQAAIDEWKNDFKGYINALDMPKDDYKGIMEYIDELPSAQPGWTPCTPETMPQESGEYLVTIKWDEGDYDVDIYEYDAYYKEWNDGELYCEKVMAWQMKPEPWKGEK